MPVITLPDGSQRSFDEAVTVLQVAESIGSGLARASLAGRVNGTLVDTSHLITDDSELAIITDRDDDGLEVIRHSCAHLMARLFSACFRKPRLRLVRSLKMVFITTLLMSVHLRQMI